MKSSEVTQSFKIDKENCCHIDKGMLTLYR